MDRTRAAVNVRRSLNKDVSLDNTVMELRSESIETAKQSPQQQRGSPRHQKPDMPGASPSSKSDAHSNSSSSTSGKLSFFFCSLLLRITLKLCSQPFFSAIRLPGIDNGWDKANLLKFLKINSLIGS